MKKKILSVTLCIAITALTGCNLDTESISTSNRNVSSKAANTTKSTRESSVEESNVEKTTEYAPTEEILNAKFNSGLVQLNNDIFQQGGYITVEDFVEKYKGRYSIRYHYPVEKYKSRISPYENCKDYLVEYKEKIFKKSYYSGRWGDRYGDVEGSVWRHYLELTPKYGETDNIVKAYVINATSKDKKIPLNKAIIAAVDSCNGELGHPSYAAPEWFPKGFNDVYMSAFEKLKCSNKNYTISQIPTMLESENITYEDSIFVNDKLNKFWKDKTTDKHDTIYSYVVGEKNIFGAKPVFCCSFEFDPNTDKVQRFTESLCFFIEE